MLYPYVQRPTTIPAPPKARIQRGTGTLEEIFALDSVRMRRVPDIEKRCTYVDQMK